MNKTNNIDNKKINYSSMIYKNGPVSVNDFINDKYTDIHVSIYNNAVQLYIEDYCKKNSLDVDEFRDTHKFIEIKQDEWWKPSLLKVISKKYPHTVETVKLNKYWTYYQYNNESKKIENLYIDEDTIVDSQVNYIDYVNGQCEMISKTTGKKFWIPFNYIQNDTRIGENILNLDNTFSYLFVNKKYGY